LELPKPAPLEAYLVRTHTRPDVLAQLETLRQTERAYWSARGQLLPTITANGDYLASQDPASNTVDGTMTIEVSAPIFDGGLIIGRINENRETVRQTRFQLDDLYRTSDEATRQAYAQLNSSLAQVSLLREAARLSAENFQGQLSDYRKGVVTNLDVLTALQDFQSTRQSLHDADMGARVNLINLFVACGAAATTAEVNAQALPIHDNYKERKVAP
jgi:outer membrane protein